MTSEPPQDWLIPSEASHRKLQTFIHQIEFHISIVVGYWSMIVGMCWLICSGSDWFCHLG